MTDPLDLDVAPRVGDPASARETMIVREFRSVATSAGKVSCQAKPVCYEQAHPPKLAREGGRPMTRPCNHAKPRFHWNLPNVLLHLAHAILLVVAMMAHPVIDRSPARTLT